MPACLEAIWTHHLAIASSSLLKDADDLKYQGGRCIGSQVGRFLERVLLHHDQAYDLFLGVLWHVRAVGNCALPYVNELS